MRLDDADVGDAVRTTKKPTNSPAKAASLSLTNTSSPTFCDEHPT